MTSPTITLGYPDLTDEAFVYKALLEHGMFPEKAPRCFQSIGLIHSPLPYSIAPPIDSKKTHSFITYQATRNTNVPRTMGIPHPESYKALCLFIKDNWFNINQHIGQYSHNESKIHVRKIPDKPEIIADGYSVHELDVDKDHIFEMNFKGSFSEQDQNKELELSYTMNANFIVKTDISNFFPSIYSHSLEWAIHGKAHSKDNRQNHRNHWGYELDKIQRSTKDNETNGILIGPHASNILSEIILCRVNERLRNEGLNQFYHHVDDYTFFAKDHDEAKRFILEFTLALKEYELTPNEKKTKILPMSDALEESWVLDLNQFQFPKGEWLHFGAIESYINRARHLQKQHANSSLLSYAISVVRGKLEKGEYKIHDNTKKLYLQLVYSLTIQFPYLCQFIDQRALIPFYSATGNNQLYLKNFIESLILNSTKDNTLDGVSHGLHLAIKYDIQLDLSPEILAAIHKTDDCISLVLLYEYSTQRNLTSVTQIIKQRARVLLQSNKREQDQYWLLIYQACTKLEMQTGRQNYLAHLKDTGFNFINFN